nr:MAG TPA: hypothetical protein [Caudoviricetes sp.]
MSCPPTTIEIVREDGSQIESQQSDEIEIYKESL